ncbi:hypothetical protein FC826_07140 [Clostridium botulinum]|uniref:Uncharacterized protein n=1 Tax=Clostridium botulinum TaxID=1491 RepID=A0A6B4U9U3_CLOBO|nr:hypothetical protein [Clostridium botulinum]NFD83612.1 hypothetical protein [Clostridium botulinum]NFE08317.1 hypothetical protein [Clostridium botulinum]NFE34157.1 hypothetical protein [Clostridium botulinum]NFE50191.1 hypothetical protein [Clostridium botulinum]
MDVLKGILLILVGVTFVFWIVLTFINLWYKSKEGGKVLLNIKRGIERNIMILMSLIIILFSLLNDNSNTYIEIVIGIVILYNGVERFEIMENGIFIEGNFKKWEDIESCEWHERLDHTLIIRGKEDVDYLRRFNTIKLKLKQEEQEQVFQIINKKIAQAS